MDAIADVGRIRIDRRSPAYWRVTFDLPPLNIFGPGNMAQLNAVVTALESDGVEAASKTIAMEHAQDGIRVNIVAPGIDAMPSPTANQEILIETLPAMRSASMTTEIIDAVVFLTEAPQIAGKVLHVDREPVDRW